MEIIENFNINLEKNSVITIGNFDGLHIGHQKLIKTVKKYSTEENLISIVISFNPHPVSFFNKDKNFKYIFSDNEKINEIKSYGIDFFIKCKFDEKFCNLKPYEFINILFEKLKCKILIVGEDYYFGKDRKGNYDLLKSFGDKHNVNVIKIEQVKIDNEKVSSSKIKDGIIKGNIKNINKFLNKPYYIFDKVLQGKKLGRTIGFPTANLIPNKNRILLPDGVYITQVNYMDKIYNSVTNIGKKPTFDGVERTVETFIFDFDKEIYDEYIKVMFFDYIRSEKKFSSIDELKKQINKDVQVSKEFFLNIKINA